ncbi:alkaline shock response membrane anchor protein AmaP [Lutibacter sp. B2]|nr:alkaline shock response membrane anchor protein AmaP [Lutibacter sp. B2]
MKFIDRILLCIYSGFILMVSLILIFNTFNDQTYILINNFLKQYGQAPEYLVILVMLFFISIRFLISGVKLKKVKTVGIIKYTSHGEINISISTIEGMTIKAIKSIIGLKEIKAIVHPLEDGLLIKIHTSVAGDTNIPETANLVQQNVKDYIEKYTEIEVKEVKIYINNIVNSTKKRVE